MHNDITLCGHEVTACVQNNVVHVVHVVQAAKNTAQSCGQGKASSGSLDGPVMALMTVHAWS